VSTAQAEVSNMSCRGMQADRRAERRMNTDQGSLGTSKRNLVRISPGAVAASISLIRPAVNRNSCRPVEG
jgi:hypothetical protein